MSAGSDGGTKAVVAALLANIGIAVTKFIAFFLTQSSSMLAEAIHSVADSGNQGLLLLGGKKAKREATPQHPFGYGRERYIYAFVVAVVLFFVGGIFAIYEAWHKFADPHPIESWHWVPVVVLGTAIVLESFSFRTAIIETNKVRGEASWVQFVRHARVPELPVILLEDLAALLGLVFAFIGVVLTLVTHNGVWDAVGSAAIGVLLIVVSAILAYEMKSLLVGEGATPEQTRAIEDAIRNSDEVADLIHMRTMHLGPEELLVAAKFAVKTSDSAADVAAGINAVEERIRAAVPIARVIYLEPDIPRAPGRVAPEQAGPPAQAAH
jgi:cation diffusion facilitator family transporter